MQDGDLRPGLTTVTPNRRLARVLAQAHAQNALDAGRATWETPPILPWEAWLDTLWHELQVHKGGTAGFPRLISPLAESVLWEQVIRDDGQLDPLLPAARVVPQLMEAWRLLHAYGGDWTRAFRPPLAAGAASFQAWAQEYERRCRRESWLDGARLGAALAGSLGELAMLLPKTLRCLGFERYTPLQERFLAALAAQGCTVERVPLPAPRVVPLHLAFADPAEELRHAAQWAAQTIGRDPQARIAVVVADLSGRSEEVRRAFAEYLAPAELLAPWQRRAAPFEISLGAPLARQPLVANALGFLEWGTQPRPVSEIFALLRSPYGLADETEFLTRSALERQLLEQGLGDLAAAQLLGWCRKRPEAAALAGTLESWLKCLDAAAPRQPPSAWRRQWETELRALTWPGGQALDSEEFQAREAWRKLLDSWIVLDALLGRVNRFEALASLRQAANSVLFQPEGQGARVAILGALEASGQEFSALWVTGLNARLWPREIRPNAFLSLAWQKQQELPQASPEVAMRHARQRLEGYLGAAATVIFSRPRLAGDETLVPSPLLAPWLPAEIAVLGLPAPAPVYAAIAAVALGEVAGAAAGVAISQTSGRSVSSYTLDAQANCPFQAYGRYRLGAQAWPEARPGLDPRERGNLVHEALRRFWDTVRDSATLHSLDQTALAQAIAQAVAKALAVLPEERWRMMPEFVHAAEAQCLYQLLKAWLALESQRPPFAVLAREDRVGLELSGLTLALRPDRLDQSADGRRLVIDYKTGRGTRVAGWLERPLSAVQLPLYALAETQHEIAGVVVARVHAQACRAEGLAADDQLWEVLKPIARAGQKAGIPDWPGLLEFWRGEAAALARDYREGRAQLAPRDPAKTCLNCDLPALCRIAEQGPRWDRDEVSEDVDD